MSDTPIGIEEFRTILRRLCALAGPQPFPRRRRYRQVILKGASLICEEGRHYDQQAIDSLLRRWLATIGRVFDLDHVYLRRLLVDEGYLRRTRDGSRYWRGAGRGGAGLFTADVDQFSLEEFAAEVRRAGEFRRFPEPEPSTTLAVRLTQVLPGREKITVEWEVLAEGVGWPEERAEQLRRQTEWCMAGARFLGLLPEFLGQATGSRIEYVIEWVGEFTFLDDQRMARRSWSCLVTFTEPSNVPVFVLCSIQGGGDGPDQSELRRVGIAYCVPRFPARGKGCRITGSGWKTDRTGEACFAFRAIDSAAEAAVRAAAMACHIGVEPLETVREDWRPRLFGSSPQA